MTRSLLDMVSRSGVEDAAIRAEKELEFLRNLSARMNCSTCFYQHHGKCNKHGEQEIPKEFAQVGCDEWAYSDIPF